MASRGCALGLFVVLLGLAPTARAALVSYAFSGVITTAEAPYGSLLGAGFSGTLTYDTGAPPVATCLPQWGGLRYQLEPPYDPAIGLDLTVSGSASFASSDAAPFGACVFDDNVVQGDAFFAYELNALELRLTDPSEAAFSSEALPTQLSSEPFEQREIRVFDAEGLVVLIGSIDALGRAPQVPVFGVLSTAALCATLACLGAVALAVGKVLPARRDAGRGGQRSRSSG